MKFTVYSSFVNIQDFENGVAIQCFPERQNAHHIAMTFRPEDVTILSNQSGIYIQKKPKKKGLRKLFSRRNKEVNNDKNSNR